jgi:hypothetical protein
VVRTSWKSSRIGASFSPAKSAARYPLFETIATFSVLAFAMMAALGLVIALIATAVELRR